MLRAIWRMLSSARLDSKDAKKVEKFKTVRDLWGGAGRPTNTCCFPACIDFVSVHAAFGCERDSCPGWRGRAERPSPWSLQIFFGNV